MPLPANRMTGHGYQANELRQEQKTGTVEVAMNTDNIVKRFSKREKDVLADEVRLNGWSLILIAHMIEEAERRLLDSDVAVDEESDAFWSRVG